MEARNCGQKNIGRELLRLLLGDTEPDIFARLAGKGRGIFGDNGRSVVAKQNLAGGDAIIGTPVGEVI